MCAIVGYYCLDKAPSQEIVKKMGDQLIHRGPDDEGVWIDFQDGIALSHRRLAVIDLSQAGHQPMLSPCERYVLVFNGEIYNHLELREELIDVFWRGCSDSETLLHCLKNWGIEKALEKIVGMFAFALWDRKEKKLTLARDRMGEKPLYYGWQGNTFLFASELSAFKAHPDFKGDIDRGALALLLRHNYIPAPHSIYEDVFKLEPGNYLTLLTNGSKRDVQIQKYWSLVDIVNNGQEKAFRGDFYEATQTLEDLLKKSVKRQMLSDVPLGAFLSGGIDSSMIVALMQAENSNPVRTFTIGFHEEGYNEAEHAKAVSQHLRTDHTELYLRPQDALNVIPKLSSMYSEPFADSSQIPTLLVCQMAKEHVTVALSGDGGDELFGGYNRYLTARDVWSKMQRLTPHVRNMLSKGLKSISVKNWDRVYKVISKALPNQLQIRTPGTKAHKLSGVMRLSRGEDFYLYLNSVWQDPSSVVKGACKDETPFLDTHKWPKTESFEHWMMAIDAQIYLPDDILVKVDRAAMSNSLETRVPMLDHRVVELAWSMPLEYKIQNSQGKCILKEVLYRYVPKELFDRPKMGFGIPLGEWLRGPLREWAEDLLNTEKLEREGLFHPEPIREIWEQHLKGRGSWEHHLWGVLMFQDWYKRNGAEFGKPS